MAMHFSGRLVQLARSAMEKFVVGVAMTVRGGRHAVYQPKNLQLGFELVGHAIDGQIGLADSVFNG
jgi:hypothetical protein